MKNTRIFPAASAILFGVALLFAFGASAGAVSLERNENGASRGPVWSKNRYGRFVQSMYGGEKPGPYGGVRTRIGGLGAELENDQVEQSGWVRYGRALFPGHRHGNAFMYGGSHSIMAARWDFGLIRAAAAEKAMLSLEDRNWTNAKLVSRFKTAKGKQRYIAVTASRLTPAVLVESDADDIVVFGGKKYNWVASGPGEPNHYNGMNFMGRAHPISFVAVGSAKGAEIKPAADAAKLPLDGLEQGWLLFWYAANPVGTGAALARHATPYWAGHRLRPELDCPFLLVFDDAPVSLEMDEMGGLCISFFPDAGGKLVLMPLFGDVWPLAKETAAWSQVLPTEIIALCDKWSGRMRHFPLKVEEDYRYNEAEDAVEIKSAFEFQPVGEGGEQFAALPPMLALAAAAGFPAAVSPALSAPEMITAIGPYTGIDGSAEYTVKIKGMGKYWKELRAPARPEEPETAKALATELERQVAKILETGVLTPVGSWYYCKYEWDTAGDYIFYLLEAWPYLTEAMRAKAMEFLDEIIEQFPPDTPARIEQWQGAPRRPMISMREFAPEATPERVSARKKEWEEFVRRYPGIVPSTFFAAYGMTPWRNLYAMSRYKQAGGSAKFPVAEKSALSLLELGIAQQDWATLGWFQWENAVVDQGSYLPYRFRWYGTGGAADANNWFNACLGAVRLAEAYGQQRDFELATALFGRAAAMRFSQTKLRAYLYEKKLWEYVPETPIIRPGGLEPSAGWIHRNEWRDIREAISLDEFGASLWDTDSAGGGAAPCSIFPLRDATPELLRFLRDYLKPEYVEYAEHYAAFDPAWYIAKKDPLLGSEATIEQPETGQQVFLMFARIAEAEPEFVRRRIDQPWYPVGDFHYWQRLVETLYSLRGEAWQAGGVKK